MKQNDSVAILRAALYCFVLGVLSPVSAAFAANTAGTGNYVRDGLVACWDGLEKGTDPSVWPDVVGGKSFALTGATFEDDRVVFTGNGNTSYGVLSETDTKATFEACKGGTLEVVFKQNGTGNMVILQSSQTTGIALGVSGGKFIVVSQGSTSFTATYGFAARTNTVSVLYGPRRICHDGEDITGTGGDYWSGAGTQTFLGTRATRAVSFNGSVYCIRLYDRQLSPAEIASNHAVDELRFAENRGAEERAGNLYVVPAVAPYVVDGLPQYGCVTGFEKDDPVAFASPERFDLTATDEVVPRGWDLQVLREAGWTTIAHTDDRTSAFAFPGEQARLVCNQKRKTKYLDLGSEYQQVEWIESTGKQYFDTGIIGRDGLASQVDMMFKTVPGDNSVLGSRATSRIYLFHVYNGFCYGYDYYFPSGVQPLSGVRYRVETELRPGYQHMSVYMPDEAVKLNFSGSSDAKSYTNDLTMTLLALRTGANSATSPVSARIYSTTIWSVDGDGNRTPLRQFVPCRRKDDPTVAGLYDLVSGEFFGDYAKSGVPFAVGPDIKRKGLIVIIR